MKGPDSSYVKLISDDGFEFFIRRRFTKVSQTITDMLNGPCDVAEDESNDVGLKDIDSVALNRACEYMCYSDRYTECWYQIPEFSIDEKLSIDLLLCASFMKC